MTSPLPENAFPSSALHDAYNQCLALEAEANASRIAPIEGCPPPLVCARLLGHLLRLAPAGNPRGRIEREITSSDHRTLMQLAASYTTHFINAFKRSSGPTPAPSKHPSPPSFEDVREYATYIMEECKIDHHTSRALAMRRDDNRCMITGFKDYHLPGGSVAVQAAHIIPQSISKNIEEYGAKRALSGGVWSILSMFTDDNIIEDLAGNRIHRLENIVSMNMYSHFLFDDLRLWLKPVENVPHTYQVCTATDTLRRFPPLPAQVTFSTATEVPLPRREFLAVHALCCEVAWMSGAAEYVIDIERRMNDTRVLANDGSTADLLTTALSLNEVH